MLGIERPSAAMSGPGRTGGEVVRSSEGRWRARPLLLAVMAVLIGSLSPALFGAEFYVDSTFDRVDPNPGNGTCIEGTRFLFCTLRGAIMEANALPGVDTIYVPPGDYDLTIPVAGEDAAATGDLDITDDVTIQGVDAVTTVVDANGLDRVFDVLNDASLTIRHLTIKGGKVAGDGWSGRGGGIRVASGSSLEVSRSRLTGNQAQVGAAIWGESMSDGQILDSEVRDNLVQENNQGSGDIVVGLNGQPAQGFRVERTSIVDNRCSGFGCATGLTLGGNCTNALSLVVNSTISGNEGSGLATTFCEAGIHLSTIVENVGAGIVCNQPGTNAGITSVIENSIIADNGVRDCSLQPGCFVTVGHHNLDSDNSCGLGTGDLPSTDPMLQSLGAVEPLLPYFARTHHPVWGSPVVDAGTASLVASADQEGFGRPLDGDQTGGPAWDMGAIEVLPCAGTLDVAVATTTFTTNWVVEACRSIASGVDVRVQTGSDVAFVAREWIAIDDGFEVESGADFRAGIVRWAGSP